MSDDEEKTQRLDFDDAKSILYFAGEDITISKSKNTDPYYLLKTIFKDREKIWNNDEIWTDWDFDKHKYNPIEDWHKIYNAAYSINEKVAKKTTIEDFLIFTKMTVQINKKYL